MKPTEDEWREAAKVYEDDPGLLVGLTAPAEPDAPADTLRGDRERVAKWLFERIVHGERKIEPRWEGLYEEQREGWLQEADAVLAVVRGQAAAVEARARLQGEAVGLREAARRIEVAHPITADRFRTLADKRDRAALSAPSEAVRQPHVSASGVQMRTARHDAAAEESAGAGYLRRLRENTENPMLRDAVIEVEEARAAAAGREEGA